MAEAKKDGAAGDKPAGKKRSLKARALRYLFLTKTGRRVLVLFALPATAVCLAALALMATLLYYTVVLPHPMVAGADRRPSIIRIIGADGNVIGERGMQRDYIPLDLMPRHLPEAVLATEDRRFRKHWGIDFTALLRAAWVNHRAGRTVEGGSTITQQLAKNLFLNSERSYGRKLEEVLIAIWLEARLSKNEILELYLNRVYFGAGAYGVETAAERYFAKSARNLTLAESATLAGLLKAPTKYSPVTSPALARKRARSVLEKMRLAGNISAEQEKEAFEQSVRFVLAKAPRHITGAEYAVDLVLEKLPGVVGDVRGDLIVETTVDPALQRRAQAIVRDHVLIEGETLDASQAAAVVLDEKGGILAIVGGRAYTESQFNRAVRARRQPGSTFKPFVYLAAIESGLSPRSIVSDDPVTIGDWSPKNFSGTHKGALTLQDALAHSVNTAAVRLYLDLGRAKVVAAARRLGIQSDLADNASIALGTSEVTPLELASAYVPFSNGGLAVAPYVIRRVRTSEGKILYEHRHAPAERVVEAKHLAAMNEMLNATMLVGTGKLAQVPGQQVGGKTGTSQDFRDAWFAGYSAHLTTVVWVGNDTARQMQKVVGGGLPAKIWREIMIAAHAGRRPRPLPGLVLIERSAEVKTTGARIESLPNARRTQPAAPSH